MVYNIGTNDMPRGWTVENEWNHKVYEKWFNMIQRCYSNKSLKRNPTYKNCTVCNRWLKLSNFVEDFKLIDGYDEELFLNRKLELDKDIKSNGKNKEYSLNNCMLVSHKKNTKQAIKTRDNSYLQGENHPNYGQHFSEETRQKMSETKKGEKHPKARKVAQYEYNKETKQQGKLIKVWNYIKEAELELKIDSRHISRCCRGKRKSAGGFKWEYVD